MDETPVWFDIDNPRPDRYTSHKKSCQVIKPYYRSGLFDTSSLPNKATLYSNSIVNDFRLDIYWNVTDDVLIPGTPVQPIVFIALILNVGSNDFKPIQVNSEGISTDLSNRASSLFKSWVGLGLGSGMIRKGTTFMTCHNDQINPPGSNIAPMRMNEHHTAEIYLPPHVSSSNGVNDLIIPLAGQGNASYQSCLFKRALNPPQGRRALDRAKNFDLLWAFNPISAKNKKGLYYTLHAENQRGKVSINLQQGTVKVVETESYGRKVVHGYGMLFFWLLLLPAGVFYARFCRSVPMWAITKAIVQTVGVLGVVAMLIVVGTSGAKLETDHATLGIVIMVFVAIQVMVGFMTFFGFSNETLYKLKFQTRLVHRVVGYSLLAFSLAQVVLGINILFPWEDPRDITAWVIFFTLTIGWILAFVLTALYHRYYILIKDFGYDSVPGAKIDDLIESNEAEKNEGNNRWSSLVSLVKRTSLRSSTTGPESGRPKFTWKDLGELTQDGHMLVVGNGKYVYDISTWMHSHPGGQIILHNVNGTDISNDYFHESGFDASEFQREIGGRQKSQTPPIRTKSNVIGLSRNSKVLTGMGRADLIAIQQQNGMKTVDIDNGIKVDSGSKIVARAESITEGDWKFILSSRRTHVHSKLAIERLSSFMVGEMLPQNNDDCHVREFEVYEYRRYAITRHVVESSRLSSRLVIRIRLCVLYPFDVRHGTPTSFLPGQCIELQTRLPNGEIISRYYTPISGDLNAFEILVRIKPEGAMAGFLSNQRVGERQVKVRGPFGNSLLKNPSIKSSEFSDYDNVFYIGGGSGITPGLQTLQHLFLSINTNLDVVLPYTATISDEMSVEPGDVVVVSHHYYDGWCFGTNTRTGASGTFPVACTCPLSPVRITLFAVSDLESDVMGQEILDGANLAYPSLVTVERFNSMTLNMQKIIPFLSSEQGSSCLVVVCGPPGLCARITDMMAELATGWPIIVLGSDKPH